MHNCADTNRTLATPTHAVLQLHREFLRAGSDVMQAFTFYASDDKLDNRGNDAGKLYSGRAINLRAVELAKTVAAEGDALTLGGVCQCPSYLSGAPKETVQQEFRKQIDVFVEAGVDFLLAEVHTNTHTQTDKAVLRTNPHPS